MAITRIGLLGGSFDPIHHAHIDLAKAALHTLNLDEVQLLPAAQPWQKKRLGATTQQRIDMLQLALDGEPKLRINPTEIERGGATYTYDTVSQLTPTAQYFWLLGSDQLQGFPSWHRWQEVLQHVELAVAQRPGSTITPPPVLAQQLHQLGKTLYHIPFTPSSMSSTQIRHHVQQQEPITTLVPKAVEHYIHHHQLYL